MSLYVITFITEFCQLRANSLMYQVAVNGSMNIDTYTVVR